MAIGPALPASVALENRVSPKVRHATPVTRTHVISMDEEQLVIHEAHLADGSRYGTRVWSSDGPLPATVTEELDVLLHGSRVPLLLRAREGVRHVPAGYCEGCRYPGKGIG